MSAYTPGPWTILEDDRAGMEWNRHIVRADAPHIRICFMASDGREADAHLIVAAPKLLKALKALVEAGWRPQDAPDDPSQWDSARAAVAEAEGEKP